MKKVLVTGAAGVVGFQVIKYLLTEGKYEITVIDLKNKKNLKRLKRFRKRVNVIYGDISNRVLMEALVKDQDIIIHLATAPLPLADMKKRLPELVDYAASENIIKAISYYNPKCHLFYASSTAIYGLEERVSVKNKINLKEEDYYNYYKYQVEELIKEKLNNYTIFRFPLILSDLRYDRFFWQGIKDQEVSYITKEDAAYSLVKSINYLKNLNHQTFNVVDEGTIKYQDLIKQMLNIYGLTFNYLLTKLFIDKNYSSPVVTDGNELNEIINFQNDSLQDYFTRLKRKTKKRKVPIFFAHLFLGKSK